jgi:hypothetical protein
MMKISEDSMHPKLLEIQSALARRPELTRRHCAVAFEVGGGTIAAWEKAGWVKFPKFKRGVKI